MQSYHKNCLKDEEGGGIVAHASRTLSHVEQRYRQTEREALAVALGTEQFHLYVNGKSVEIITYHKPLEGYSTTREASGLQGLTFG